MKSFMSKLFTSASGGGSGYLLTSTRAATQLCLVMAQELKSSTTFPEYKSPHRICTQQRSGKAVEHHHTQEEIILHGQGLISAAVAQFGRATNSIWTAQDAKRHNSLAGDSNNWRFKLCG